jgi:hypothetical protein
MAHTNPILSKIRTYYMVIPASVHVSCFHRLGFAQTGLIVLTAYGKTLVQDSIDSSEFERMQTLNTTLQTQLATQRESRAGRGDRGGRGGRGGRGPGCPNTGEYAWKDVPPATGEPQVKTVGTKTYHWCPKHIVWTVHTPTEHSLPDETPAPAPAVETSGLPNTAQSLAAVAGDQGNLFHDIE